jgi:ABC-type branched-subunit amino acid transport system ATPase component
MTGLACAAGAAALTGSAFGDPELLRARDLRMAYGGNTVLDGVEASVRRGEVVLLCGENGSGKTTLLNILTGNLVPDSGALRVNTRAGTREFVFRGSRTARSLFHPEHLANAGLGRSWQDTRLFATQSLLHNVAVARPGQLGERPLAAIARREASWRAEQANRLAAAALLTRLGLSARADSSADMVSLGQAKRVEIARAMYARAEVLFLDEPLAGLDSTGREEVLRLLRELVERDGVTLVMIEHLFNIPHLLDLATTVWTVRSGALHVEEAKAARQRLLADSRGGLEAGEWIVREFAGDGWTVTRSRLGADGELTVCAPPGPPREAVLSVRDLVVARGKRLAVGNVAGDRTGGLTFSLRAGEVAVLQAPNGWGKTTLLEAIVGLLPVRGGSIAVSNRAMEHRPVWERVAAGVSFCRSRDQGFPELTVRDAFRLSRVERNPPGLGALLNRRMWTLSGGERQRVALACSLERSPRPKIALLDEPLSALDPAGVRTLRDMLCPKAGSATLIAIPVTRSGR